MGTIAGGHERTATAGGADATGGAEATGDSMCGATATSPDAVADGAGDGDDVDRSLQDDAAKGATRIHESESGRTPVEGYEPRHRHANFRPRPRKTRENTAGSAHLAPGPFVPSFLGMSPIVQTASSALVGEGVPASRKRVAIGIAILSDALQVALFPVTIEGAASPGELALDALTAVVMMMVLGFNWRIGAAFALELVPGIALFPSWTAMAMMLPARADAPAPTVVEAREVTAIERR